jgi:hypothetical protein
MTINLELESYLHQVTKWPTEGKHILAQYTEEYIVVYQAYRSSIGKFAAENQYFGGEYSYSRMSWIKPNFLWLMYRSDWGKKEGQETTLAIKLKLDFFEEILKNAVVSTFKATKYKDKKEWKQALQTSNVRLQWDPDHDPQGNKEIRRAMQLGLRNELLEPFKGDGIIEIEDISSFVKEQRDNAFSRNYDDLIIPKEKIFIPRNKKAALNVEITNFI